MEALLLYLLAMPLEPTLKILILFIAFSAITTASLNFLSLFKHSTLFEIAY
jgi:hypothetical protein